MNQKEKIENTGQVLEWIVEHGHAHSIVYLDHNKNELAETFKIPNDFKQLLFYIMHTTIVFDTDCYCGRTDCNMCITTVKNILKKTRYIVVHSSESTYTMKLTALHGGNIYLESAEKNDDSDCQSSI